MFISTRLYPKLDLLAANKLLTYLLTYLLTKYHRSVLIALCQCNKYVKQFVM